MIWICVWYLDNYYNIDVADILGIHRYLMIKNNMKQCSGLLNKVFVALLRLISSTDTKCMSLSNEPCIARSILIDLNPIELNYYAFIISLDKFSWSCNAINHLSMTICLPSKTKDKNVIVVMLLLYK